MNLVEKGKENIMADFYFNNSVYNISHGIVIKTSVAVIRSVRV